MGLDTIIVPITQPTAAAAVAELRTTPILSRTFRKCRVCHVLVFLCRINSSIILFLSVDIPTSHPSVRSVHKPCGDPMLLGSHFRFWAQYMSLHSWVPSTRESDWACWWKSYFTNTNHHQSGISSIPLTSPLATTTMQDTANNAKDSARHRLPLVAGGTFLPEYIFITCCNPGIELIRVQAYKGQGSYMQWIREGITKQLPLFHKQGYIVVAMSQL
jgi:hypothetical protein